MKAARTLVAAGLATALLAIAASASADAAAYRHYVACGTTAQAKPSHACHKRQKKAAFFRSNLADVFYKVCVKFPPGIRPRLICTRRAQLAREDSLYYNRITSNAEGRHKVTWWVKGERVGVFFFRVFG